MRLKKILLGSAAVMMGAGVASVPAKAADMNGLVTTMANYLESCANGVGIQLDRTCFRITGSVEFEALFGERYNWGYGPDDTDDFDPDEPDGDGGEDVDDEWYTGIDPTLGYDASVSAGIRFSWDANAYSVTINFPDPFRNLERFSVSIDQTGGLWFWFQNGVTGGRSQIEVGGDAGPLEWMVGIDDVGDGFPGMDFTVGLEATFGNFGVGAEVEMEDLFMGFDPRFSLEFTGDLGPIGFDIDVATRDWGPPLDPTIDVRVTAGFGPFSLTGFFGWENDGGDTDRAFGAEVEAEFGNAAVTVGALFGEAGHGATGAEDDRWGFGPSNPFPYLGLGEGESFYAIWGGFDIDWNSRHSTGLNIVYANSNDAMLEHPDFGDPDPGPLTAGADYDCSTGNCATLRSSLTHTWMPVEGDVEVGATLYAENAFGSPHGWAFGAALTLTVPFFP